ncbi:MAG: lysostaphin resistance A-like protein [Gammaproteobacteria bacterium]
MELSSAISRQPGKLWKFLQFPLTRILTAAVGLVGVMLIIQFGAHVLHIKSDSPVRVVISLLIITAVVSIYHAYVRVIEKRSVSEFSWRGALPEFLWGWLAGALLFSSTMLVLWWLGVARITPGAGWMALGYSCIGSLTAAVFEETLVRGVLFRIIEESLGSWIALAISAVVFGALHLFNPGATVISALAIALEAGVLLGAVYMYTRRLWMAIGLHAAWNFTEGGVFGASVSGGHSQGAMASHFLGPELLTGGKFGPEASLVAVMVCLAAGAIFLWLAWKCQHVLQPVWRRARVSHAST